MTAEELLNQMPKRFDGFRNNPTYQALAALVVRKEAELVQAAEQDAARRRQERRIPPVQVLQADMAACGPHVGWREMRQAVGHMVAIVLAPHGWVPEKLRGTITGEDRVNTKGALYRRAPASSTGTPSESGPVSRAQFDAVVAKCDALMAQLAELRGEIQTLGRRLRAAA